MAPWRAAVLELVVGRRWTRVVLLVYGAVEFGRTADKLKNGRRASKHIDKESVDASA